MLPLSDHELHHAANQYDRETAGFDLGFYRYADKFVA